MNTTLAALLPANIFAIALVFCRAGAAITLMPGFGDNFIPVRVRLVVGLSLALIVTPVVADQLPAMPASPVAIVLLIAGEFTIGLFIGFISRAILAALDTAGAMVATQTSLSSAITFNPGAQQPETLPASLFGILAVVLIFTTDLYGVMLRGIVDSYQSFPAGAVPPFDDMARAVVRLVSKGFEISVRLAAPYLLLGTLFYIGLGLIGRIMPQLQVFYIGLPLQIMGGLAVLSLTLGSVMLWFLGAFEEVLRGVMRLN